MGAFYLSAIISLLGNGINDNVLKQRLAMMLSWVENEAIPWMERVCHGRGGTWQSLTGCSCSRHKYGEVLMGLGNVLNADFLAPPYDHVRLNYFFNTFIIKPGLLDWPAAEVGVEAGHVIFKTTTIGHPAIPAKTKNGIGKWYSEHGGVTYPAWTKLVGWWDTDLPVVQPGELPLDCVFKGPGWTVGRSGWGTDDVYLLFISGNNTVQYGTGNSHDYLYSNNNKFLIYKGATRIANFGEYLQPVIPYTFSDDNPSAPRMAYPEGFRTYGSTTYNISHGKIIAYESTPEYMYVCGDASLDYVEDVTYLRHMVFIKPGSLIVYDCISDATSWNKTAPSGVSNAQTLTEQTGTGAKLLHFFQVDGSNATVVKNGESSVSVTIPESNRTFRFDFPATCLPGGAVQVTGGSLTNINRALTDTVRDHWGHWQGDSRFTTWSTDSRFDFLKPLSPDMPVDAAQDNLFEKQPDIFPILYSPAPNPFRPAVSISYRLYRSVTAKEQGNGHVKLEIYDMVGKLVRTLVNKTQGPGYYRVTWDGRDNSGKPIASGSYVYRLVWNGHTISDSKLLTRIR
jgi:hypothetical protein